MVLYVDDGTEVRYNSNEKAVCNLAGNLAPKPCLVKNQTTEAQSHREIKKEG